MSRGKRRRRRRRGKQPTRAAAAVAVCLDATTADKYELYQRAVQSPDVDVDFLIAAYRHYRRRDPRHLREDFCGTARLAAEWVGRAPDRTAEGFDIDPEPLAWGRRHNLEPLGEEVAARVVLHQRDFREPGDRPADIRIAPNFSWQMLRERADLLSYARTARAELAPGGLFVLDIYGGPDAYMEMEEETELETDDGPFTYVWEQAAYHPGSGEYAGHIHFRFADGSALERAFSYTWRFWHLTEVKDVLRDAGFRRVEAWFEGTDEETGEGNGEFAPDPRGENTMAWIAYLVATD